MKYSTAAIASYFLLPALLLLATIANGQNLKLEERLTDSLKSRVLKMANDTGKVSLLLTIAERYREDNYEESMRFGSDALKLASTIKWKAGVAKAYDVVGYGWLRKGKYSQALDCFENALDAINGEKSTAVAIHLLIHTGETYLQMGDYPRAMNYFLKASDLAVHKGTDQEKADCLMGMGGVYSAQGDLVHTLEYYNKALRLYEMAKTELSIVRTLTNIGHIYFESGDVNGAKQNYENALQRAQAIGNSRSVAENLSNIGNVYAELEHMGKALEYQFMALGMYRQMNATNLTANVLGNIGTTFLVIAADSSKELPVDRNIPSTRPGVLRKAIEYLQKSIDMLGQTHELRTLQQFQENLAAAYAINGNYQQAYDLYQSSVSIKDSLFSAQNALKMAKLITQKEVEMKDQQIRFSNLRFLFLLAITLLVLLIAVLVFVSFRRQRTINDALELSNTLLGEEKKKSDDLLLNILPAEVADELKASGTVNARQYDSVTVMLTDFVNFTVAGERMHPRQLLHELHECFKEFDRIAERHGVEKIKTIGDAYLAVCGLPVELPDHAQKMVAAALEIHEFMRRRHERMGDETFGLRIGIHSGTVVAGVVGYKKYAYDIWGDTVNTAARMEQNCEPDRINISEATYQLVKGHYHCIHRGKIEAKNKGTLDMYYVDISATS